MPFTTLSPETSSIENWIYELDTAIEEEVTGSHPFGWDEDHITYAWIVRLMRQFQNVYITGDEDGARVSWQAFKAKGPLENKVGDVAVIVRFSFLTGSPVTGIGLLEAKRFDAVRNSYYALDWRQLRRESRGRSNHRVLLYDFADIEADGPLVTQLHCEHQEPESFTEIHAVTLPTAHVIARKRRDREIATGGLPLAYQLGVRYLRGYDLEYNRRLINEVENAQPSRVHYVIVASVEQGEAPTTTGGEPAPLNPSAFDHIALDAGAQVAQPLENSHAMVWFHED